jgi:hypothetical protein
MVPNARPTELLAKGKWGEVRAIVTADGKCPTSIFLAEELDKVVVSKNPITTTAADKCSGWFELLADEGKLPAKRFRSEADGFLACCFEIRNKQIRFPCFRDGNCWIITHGFFKPGAQKGLGKWPTEQINRANRFRTEYWERKSQAQREP